MANYSASHSVSVPASRPASISELFQALADPTRCAIVRALADGAQTVSVLAEPFEMALPSFMKHLGVLERSGLVRSSKSGRTRRCELVPARLAQAEQWLAEQRAMWEARSDRMVAFVERLHQEEQAHVKARRRTD
ncbi:ArsR family transcriptional regulator [Burkholderia gladioli]|uniref:Metalloregulator ArsR/SmtB family transcription factor n=1 Tax=Burkholderia gladioli TaxID=28095 RepID=A0AB38TV98_BURGA|nr:metalloregulator ArsR/SmtB family transcription factor [Burkholderia gladioli]KVM62463.1 ArsR family transcriptional regulator [Burkholderia gladioli]MBU9270366.1 metalloregulator ArsR/SmtB family transcription factor [Burkholderia gladioli]MBU9272854.1 metalloregulator ArsR/SmtB family transcription factor [Burkholderia gladioli]MBU9644345.1 metalloregulator ArsR/SmtB family transcription factor [Burkholderia gladioli]MBU9685391.1 metalloregulator ArsR/SmtB family transcription factor [Bur